MKEWMQSLLIVSLIIVIIILVIGGLAIMHRSFTLGSDSDDYDIVCIHGHEYYRANFMTKIALGIKLNQDGKPFKCE